MRGHGLLFVKLIKKEQAMWKLHSRDFRLEIGSTRANCQIAVTTTLRQAERERIMSAPKRFVADPLGQVNSVPTKRTAWITAIHIITWNQNLFNVVQTSTLEGIKLEHTAHSSLSIAVLNSGFIWTGLLTSWEYTAMLACRSEAGIVVIIQSHRAFLGY